jgi:hypothetical protein
MAVDDDTFVEHDAYFFFHGQKNGLEICMYACARVEAPE